MGHLVGASCGYRKTFRGPRSDSRSLQIKPKSVRPAIHPPARFFFWSRFWGNEVGYYSTKREKRRPKKWYCVDNVIEVTQNKYTSGTGRVHIRYTYGTYQVHAEYTTGTWVDKTNEGIELIKWLAGSVLPSPEAQPAPRVHSSTYCKELNFNFPEHQKCLKSIKNSSKKMKKSENLSKMFDIFEKIGNLENFRFFKSSSSKKNHLTN